MVLLCLAFASIASSADLSCPANASGKHPNCICKKEYHGLDRGDHPYDAINRICPIQINVAALQGCPKGTRN